MSLDHLDGFSAIAYSLVEPDTGIHADVFAIGCELIDLQKNFWRLSPSIRAQVTQSLRKGSLLPPHLRKPVVGLQRGAKDGTRSVALA